MKALTKMHLYWLLNSRKIYLNKLYIVILFYSHQKVVHRIQDKYLVIYLNINYIFISMYEIELSYILIY